MDGNLDGVVAGNRGEGQVAPLALAPGGRPSRSKVNRRVARRRTPLGSGSGSDQSGVGPSTKRSTGASLGAATSTTTRSCSPPGSRCTETNGKAFAGAERDAARHAQLGLFQRRLFGAVAG